MTYLPVPPLAHTLARYQEVVSPLLEEHEAARTAEICAEFEAGDGPRLQEALERNAEAANGDGTSWLTDLWYAAYLASRTPLTLTSNVGFELAWPEEDEGLDRATRLAHRLARIHLHHTRGEIEPQTSPRGEALCMRQWSYLAGGMRRPGAEIDEIVPGPEDPARREIVVLHRGRAFAVPVSDEHGDVIPLSALRTAFERVLATTADAPATGWGEGEETPFSAWSYLGSVEAAAYERELLADSHNADTYDRLLRAFFVFTLLDDAATPEEHALDTAFTYGRTWPFKPVGYLACLADRYAGMHIEHTVADGGTLQTAIGLAQELPDDPDTPRDEIDEAAAGSGEADSPHEAGVEGPEPLTWTLTDDQRARLAADVAVYEEEAAHVRLRVVRAPIIDGGGRRISADAVQQLAILYAQLRTYGRVRSTYESVDMREFQAGRTEAMRPVTPEAVTLAQAMVADAATPGQLDAAFAAHKRRIIQCKKGEGVDRHLLGLRVMAGELGLSTALFEDAAYRRLTTDFLSTTSLGTDDRIVRYIFAPTTDGGIGVDYSRRSTGEYEFVLIHGPKRDGDIEEFAAALEDGISRIAALVATTG